MERATSRLVFVVEHPPEHTEQMTEALLDLGQSMVEMVLSDETGLTPVVYFVEQITRQEMLGMDEDGALHRREKVNIVRPEDRV